MQTATGSPEDLRRFFHQEIDRMEPSRLEFLNRLLQQLRLFELADQIDRGFDADREAGYLSMDKDSPKGSGRNLQRAPRLDE